jgi:hypothetical protein
VSDIDATLAERGSKYGAFSEHSRIAQNLKQAMGDSPNWGKLSPDKREALEMVQHKIARILNGDPEYHDNALQRRIDATRAGIAVRFETDEGSASLADLF